VLTVRSLRVRPVNLPLERPIQTAAAEIPTSPLVLLDIETEEGVTGCSYVFCYTPVAMAATAAALGEIDLAGEDLAPVPLWNALRKRFMLLGASGVLGFALAAIDMAAWDAQARAAERPLVELLGGSAETPVAAYAGMRSMRPVDAAREAEEWLAAGHRELKVKLGGRDPDLEVIGALPDVPLMVDYNQTLTRAEARRRLWALEGEGLQWVEEPIAAEDVEGLAALAAEFDTPIQAGESWWGPGEARRSIEAQGSDFVMLDVARIGGVTGWLRAAALAETAGVPLSSHAYPELSAHLLAASPMRHRLEHSDHTGHLIAEPLVVKDGFTTPGPPLTWT
jgi:mandelate racemase